MTPGATDRAEGVLVGQLAGDALGSLVEFRSAEEILSAYPGGVRELRDGGTWNTLAGQPTDDSEMALALARSLVERGKYDVRAVRAAYVEWLESGPFDCGRTVYRGLSGRPDPGSQANGALMRASPLGIFGAGRDPVELARWAEEDAALTHPHPVCRQANVLYVLAIALAVRTGAGPREVYREVERWADEIGVDDSLRRAIAAAAEGPPEVEPGKEGWVLVAFGNALWRLLDAPTLEEGVVETIGMGGDTDTNAAICGALLGAVHGRSAIPERWVEGLLSCRPEAGWPGIRHPRPRRYWPVDAPELARALLAVGTG